MALQEFRFMLQKEN